MAIEKNIEVLEGDCSGPEIMREGLKALDAVSRKYGHKFNLHYADFGAQAYHRTGNCYPAETKRRCLEADAVLKGPVGLDRDGMRALQAKGIKLENHAILPLRGDMDTYLCLRPVYLHGSCASFSPLRPEVIGEGIDILMMRELVGGVYFGDKIEAVEKGVIVREKATDICDYTTAQVERFAHACFKEARTRVPQFGNKGAITNVSKPNVLATGRLWDAVFRKVKEQYQDITFEEGIVDAVAYDLVKNPRKFNGIMALENLQGDILTDQAGGIIGSLGLMPSACINPETGRAYYEPSHGSAPDIAGQNKANPYAMIGCIAFMLDKSFGLKEESRDVWNSLTNVFAQGYMTGELVRKLDDSQRKARNEDDLRRLYPAFQAMNPLVTKLEAEILISEANKKYDTDLGARVVSTSHFGELVAKNILGDK
jgi:3-isopropylmalate dehydrogenase